MIKMIDNECITVGGAVKCENMYEVELLMDWLDRNGYTWSDKCRYTDYSMCDKYKCNSGYRILSGTYCNLDKYRGRIFRFDEAFCVEGFIRI